MLLLNFFFKKTCFVFICVVSLIPAGKPFGVTCISVGRIAYLSQGKVPISSTVQRLCQENLLNGVLSVHLYNCINVCFSEQCCISK